MPIASAAGNWAGSQENLSSKSSLFSKETPHSNNKDNADGLYRPFSGDPVRDDVGESSRASSDDEAVEGATEVELNWLRQKCGQLIDDGRTQTFILLLIALSSIMIGAQGFPIVQENPQLDRAFEIVDLMVLVVFTIESLVHFIFLGLRRFVKDRWLVFDFTIVVISWIALRVRELMAFRVFRAWRFVTQVTRLRNVVVAVLSIMPAIGAIFTLLLLIVYIFAVMFTTLFNDYKEKGYTDTDYFGRLDKSVFTLFQVICLDEWSGIALEITAHEYWVGWIIFIAFIVMSSFVVLNLLVAVICDALKILREAENKMLLNKLRGLENFALEQPPEEGEGVEDEQRDSNERTRQRVTDMQKMLDEMVSAQENMARTLQYLSLALYAQRKAAELVSIRETMSNDAIERKDVGVTTTAARVQ